jgi:hypothetical protein
MNLSENLKEVIMVSENGVSVNIANRGGNSCVINIKRGIEAKWTSERLTFQYLYGSTINGIE